MFYGDVEARNKSYYERKERKYTMEYIEKLTEKQQTIFDVMLHMVELKQNYLLSSEDRGIGKTITLNELAFTLQALGYEVYLLSPFPHEFYTDGLFSGYSESYKGRLKNNSVVIVDELRYENMSDFLDYCEYRNVPVIGFVNFNCSKLNDYQMYFNTDKFKLEYKYNWDFQF